MNEEELGRFKAGLIAHCAHLLELRIQHSFQHMQALQEAANEEEKSSAGDKYETSRAMNQRDKDMHARQFIENQKELAMFLSIVKEPFHGEIRPGRLVDCQQIIFFIAAGLGKLKFDDRTVVVLSPNAPLAKTIIGKKLGQNIVFSGQTLEIMGIV